MGMVRLSETMGVGGRRMSVALFQPPHSIWGYLLGHWLVRLNGEDVFDGALQHSDGRVALTLLLRMSCFEKKYAQPILKISIGPCLPMDKYFDGNGSAMRMRVSESGGCVSFARHF